MLFLLNSLVRAIGVTVNFFFFLHLLQWQNKRVREKGYFMWHGLKCLLFTSFHTAIVLFSVVNVDIKTMDDIVYSDYFFLNVII